MIFEKGLDIIVRISESGLFPSQNMLTEVMYFLGVADAQEP